MKRTTLLLVLSIFLTLFTNISYSQSATEQVFDRSANEWFGFGADISWGGSNFKNKNGVSKDLLSILKEQGVNSVRYRVWYPDNGPSGKNEVVRNAKAAHDMGFKVMIDFHYSDSWADPGKQFIPSAWEGHTTDQLVQDVYNHTYDVLSALKNVGVTPTWVQIGNETKRGMLWPNGNTNDTPGGFDNFARMINSGYDAIKAVDSTIQAIVHLPDADENSLYRWMFDGLKKRGAKWDIIGMSAYPRWAHLEWEEEIRMSINNMKDMIARYDTKVMVVETGHYWYEPYISNHFLVELMNQMIDIGGLGCFWWEPQATMVGVYELTAWNPDTRQPTIAMDAYLGIKHNDPQSLIHVSLEEPLNGTTYAPGEDITITANASHTSGEIEQVSFFVNGSRLKTIKEAPYTFDITVALPAGNYEIYAKAKDTKGNEVQSETAIIQIGYVTTIQENTNGFCGITNDLGSVDNNNLNYTGTGFVNTDNVAGAAVNWTVNFIETGKYELTFRYAATSNRPGNLKINGKELGNLALPSSGSWDIWKIASMTYTVTKAGEQAITLTATSGDGLPNIDYLSIKPISNTSKIEVSSNCVDHSNGTSAIDIASEKANLKAYSIPNQKIIVVESIQNIEELSIYKIDGSLVKKLSNINNKRIEIPYNNLNSGMYLIKTTRGNNSFIKKFNVQ